MIGTGMARNGRGMGLAKLRHDLAVGRREPVIAIGLALALLFAFLILAPVISILANVAIVQIGDAARSRAPEGAFTLYYVTRAFASRMSGILLWQPLLNTASIAVGAIILSMTVGGVLAWLVNRTDLVGRRWLATALIIPFMLPTWTLALAWTTIFKNRTVGGQPGWLEMLGFVTPDWMAYGRFPIIIILSLHYAPFVILILGAALQRLDAQLEDSARILGASRRRVAFQIVLPLMRPALLSCGLLILADCIGEFAVPYVLGLPVGFDTLSTSLYRAISTRQSGMAAVMAAVIMAIGVVTLYIDTRMMREARRFAIVGGKGAMDRRRTLGRWQIAAIGFALSFFVLGVVVPLVTLFLSTIMRVPGRFTPENFTFDYWIGSNLDTVALRSGILLTPEFWSAGLNTLVIIGAASLASGILGLLVGYVVIRSPFAALGAFLRQITFMPYLVPGIAFAAAMLTLFAVPRGPLPALYGTSIILILALVADQMPFASRSGIAAMAQLGKEPEEAARVAGAGWWRRMTSIVLPIQKRALASAILLPFISGIKGVSLFIILAVPATDVLTTYSLRLVDYNYTQAANAVVLMIALLALFGTILINRLTGNGIARGLES
ncbi:ABC transporter permease [Neorhizobium sp. NPDC001467]|uniref:ABC transporter permease n=1 Tax=Neorhizobium sp. NPDC001467 TaxID=3390595 RepID=UPI003D08963C